MYPQNPHKSWVAVVAIRNSNLGRQRQGILEEPGQGAWVCQQALGLTAKPCLDG